MKQHFFAITIERIGSKCQCTPTTWHMATLRNGNNTTVSSTHISTPSPSDIFVAACPHRSISSIGGAVAKLVRAFDWRQGGPGFESRCGNLIRFGTLAIPFTPLCQCLSEETLKTVGPFYLVSMPGEVKYPTSLHWKCVTCRALHHPLWETTCHRGPHWN